MCLAFGLWESPAIPQLLEAMVVFPLIQTLLLLYKDVSSDYMLLIFESLTQHTVLHVVSITYVTRINEVGTYLLKYLYCISVLHEMLEDENIMSSWIYRYGREGNLRNSQIYYSLIHQVFFLKFWNSFFSSYFKEKLSPLCRLLLFLYL